MRHYHSPDDLSWDEWRLSNSEVERIDLENAASPEEADELEEMTADEMAVDGYYVVKVLPWVVVGAGGLGAGKTSGAGTRGVSLDVVIGGRTGHSDANGGESSDNRSKIHADCGPAENPSL